MRDEESKSLWDHITGECFDGPLAGSQLDFWHVSLTNVLAERTNYPQTILLKSGYRSVKSSFMKGVIGNRMSYNKEGTMLGPHFRKTMSKEIDHRLPEGEQGLGVMDALNQGKFYPVKEIPKGGFIEDVWLERPLRIERNELDGVPKATWTDNRRRTNAVTFTLVWLSPLRTQIVKFMEKRLDYIVS